VAVLFTVLHYLCLVATITFTVILAMNPRQEAATPVFIGLGVSMLTWFIAFFRRRSARCPLCKGTPLLNTRASTHVKATRVYPLNHGTTAVLSILFTHRFRCMYCGTPYDLLKVPSSSRHGLNE
jgi:hypothetical protein